MFTRRNFLKFTSAGVVALAGECRPANAEWLHRVQKADPGESFSLQEREKIAEFKSNFLGFPVNMNTPPEEFFTWRRRLARAGVSVFAYNNVGNPFRDSPILYNTHDFEQDIILVYGRMYGFDSGDVWGFLSNSGTDSNMHGMYIGRTVLKARCSVAPKCYYTREAHYSIQILTNLLNLDPVLVETTADGGMDADDLRRKTAENPDNPALVVATIGTTFKGAVDRLDAIQDALKGCSAYVHLDAALFGGYLPHTSYAGEMLRGGGDSRTSKRYDSLAVSCHKFFGFPAPAGLFITTRANFDEFHENYSKAHSPEYIGHVPGTITCSRDAVKPAEFHHFTTPAALARLAEDSHLVLQNAQYLFDQMRSQLPNFSPIRSCKLSNTLYFRHPGDVMVKKYSLAAMKINVEGRMTDWAHVVLMPHAQRDVLDRFLTDLDAGSAVKL